MTPSIEFIIPAYNAASTLGDTLASLCAQTDPRWAAIVVDDGSTDATAALVRTIRDTRRDSRLLLARQRNAGLAAARNTGFALSRADLVCFLDADDTIDPSFVATLTSAIGDRDLIACATRMVDADLADLGWTIAPGPADTTIQRLTAFNPFAVGSVVMRRSAPRARGLLRSARWALFDPRLSVHEDWDLWLRLTAAGAHWAPPIPAALFNYRLRPGSMTSDINQMHEVGLAVIARHATQHADRLARDWTLRHLARAIAADDAPLAAALTDRLRTQHDCGTPQLDDHDLGVLQGSLTHALMQADRVGPRQAALHTSRWRARLERTLADAPLRCALLAHVDVLATDWASLARLAVASLSPGQELVVYGAGRNGRALLGALDLLEPKPAASWIDDGPAAVPAGFDRLTPDQLDAHHVVLVTPDDAGAILDQLADSPVAAVLTRRSLAQAARPAHAPSRVSSQ